MRGSLLRAGVGFMALISAGVAFGQMYYPEDYAIPPAPIPRHGPPIFDPQDDFPPMGPYFFRRFRERLGARLAPRLMLDEPPRHRARPADPPAERRNARGDRNHSARAPSPPQEGRNRTTTRPVTARNDNPPARVDAPAPLRPARPSASTRPTSVAIDTTSRSRETTAAKPVPSDGASGFVNKGEMKLNQ
jgi:hypothetical protein